MSADSTQPTSPLWKDGTSQPGSTGTDDAEVLRIVAEYKEAQERRERIEYEVRNELIRREARRLADAEERKDERQPVWRSLTEQLQQPLTEQRYSIEGILPLGGNALFAGRYKAGKTTFNGQLIKAWADNVPYLGLFDVHPDPERPVVTIFNYEMSEDQFQRWLMKVGVENTDNVQVVHLRGLHTPLALPEKRAELAAALDASRTGLWIIDPASRAFAGAGDVLSNADVAQWLGWLDEVKLRGNVRDLVLNIHMGHAAASDAAAERAIGAQAWSAWADSLWYLNFEEDKKNKVKHRVFWAEGRDVSQDRLYVHYDEESMGVILMPDPPVIQGVVDQTTELRNGIRTVIGQNPGRTQDGIVQDLHGLGIKVRKQDVVMELRAMEGEGSLIIRTGPRNSRQHYPPDWFERLDQD